MILKVITLAAILAVIETRPQDFSHGHGHLHGHGHAFSSQSIVMHQDHQEPIYYRHSKPHPNQERDHYHIHRVPVKSQGYRQPLNQYFGVPFNQPGIPFTLSDARPQKSMLFNHNQELPMTMNDHRNKKPNHNFMSHPELEPHREYEFNYNIADIDTGDHKTHHETRNDGVVKGVYSFQEADGSIRIVEYTADEHNGFHANVRHEGLKHKLPKYRPQNRHPIHPHYQNNRHNFHPLLFNKNY